MSNSVEHYKPSDGVSNIVDRVLSVIFAPAPLLTIILTLILIALSLISGITLTYVEWAMVVLAIFIGVLFRCIVHTASVWYVALRSKPAPRRAMAIEDFLVGLIMMIFGNFKQFWLTPLEMLFAKHWILPALWYLELIIIWVFPVLQLLAALLDGVGLRYYSSFIRYSAMLMILVWLFSLLTDFMAIELPVLPTIQQNISFFIIEIFIFVLFTMLYDILKYYLQMRYSLFEINIYVTGDEQDVDEFTKMLKNVKDLEYEEIELEATAFARIEGLKISYKSFFISEGYIPVLKLVLAWLKQCKDKESIAKIALPSPLVESKSCAADKVEHIEKALKFLEGLSRWQTLKISFGF